MSENPLVSSEACEGINRLVSTSVDSSLFIFMHYNPSYIPVFGQDARFLLEINNFYKLLVDASICNQLSYIFRGDKYKAYINDIEKNKKLIKHFRTALAHNQAQVLNNDYSLRETKKWLIKYNITTALGYSLPLESLENCAYDVISIISKLINLYSSEADCEKEKIIARWQMCILKKYSSPGVGGSIIRNLLRIQYEANAPTVYFNDWLRNKYEKQKDNVSLLQDYPRNNPKLKQDLKKVEQIMEELSNCIDYVEKNGHNTRDVYIQGYVVFIQNYITRDGEKWFTKNKTYIKNLLPEEFISSIIKQCLDAPAKLVIDKS